MVRLDTNGALGGGHRALSGERLPEVPAFNDDPYAHHWFEKRLA